MESQKESKRKDWFLVAAAFLGLFLIGGSFIYSRSLKYYKGSESRALNTTAIVLPIKWGNLGKQLIETGVIDDEKFKAVYSQRGGLSAEDKKLLYGENNDSFVINSDNAGLLLNLLWALGLGNKNPILGQGPMMDPRYGGAGRFASTGGWTLAKGDAMNHYGKHSFLTLTKEQQELVEKVSKNIYRPCCDNSTYFPDCNHGMAMLGLLELMASQGVKEEEMYKTALIFNSYWFPENYSNINKYLENRGLSLESANPKEILGRNFSSASGYQQILAQITPTLNQGGGSCGV